MGSNADFGTEYEKIPFSLAEQAIKMRISALSVKALSPQELKLEFFVDQLRHG